MGANNTVGKAFDAVGKIGALAVGGPLGFVAGKKLKSALVPGAVAAPDAPDPVEMPDPLEQMQARRRSLVEQLSRGGRASTIMTDRGKLGG